jgi:hypothetical protein
MTLSNSRFTNRSNHSMNEINVLLLRSEENKQRGIEEEKTNLSINILSFIVVFLSMIYLHHLELF